MLGTDPEAERAEDEFLSSLPAEHQRVLASGVRTFMDSMKVGPPWQVQHLQAGSAARACILPA